MAHQVHWTKQILEDFIEEALLDSELEFIIRKRCQNWTVTQTAQALNKSESSIHKSIAKLKKMYDVVQEANPQKFPKRRVSDKETYLDTH